MIVQQSEEALSMVERVARALARHDNPSHENWWPSYESRARTAIGAMMEPTEKQLDAVRYLVQWHTFERPTEAALLRHARCLGKKAPDDCRDVEHAPATNMVSYWIHRGIIGAALKERS